MRRALNATYVAIVEHLPPDVRLKVDESLNPPPPPTAAQRKAALARRSMEFARQGGGEVG